jgi:hypothetical protein
MTSQDIIPATNASDSAASADIILTVKVLGAKHLKGSKGDHINSLVRVQFADYDFKDV